MNINQKIQIIESESGVEIFTKIAQFVSGNEGEPTAHVGQQIIVERGVGTHYDFHKTMRAALDDDCADLISYNGGTGACYAAWTPKCSSANGMYRVAVLPRRKTEQELTLPEIVEI